MNLLVFILLCLLFVGLVSVSHANTFILNITTNTLYLNNNTTLNIYATSNTLISGWIGANALNLTHTTQSFNTTTYISIPYNYYYQFNFTTANFIGVYPLPIITPLLINQNKTQQYAPLSLILFGIAMILSIFVILLLFGFFNYQTNSLIGGIIGLSIAFITALIMIMAIMYTTTSISSTYTVNTITQVITIHSTNISTQALGTNNLFGLYAYIMIFIDFICGFVFLFISFISFNKIKNINKYKE